MSVSLLRVVGFSRSTELLWIRPERADWLASLGLTTALDFLALPGVVVSGHVGRNVSRVKLGDTTAYLKREHRIRLRDRFRSWLDGFGWSSISAREAAVLRRLDQHGLPGPQWLAYGEADGQGFLLLDEVAGAVELRSLPGIDEALAERLARIVAGTHAAGVDQPDLFGKHIFVGPNAGSCLPLAATRSGAREPAGASIQLSDGAALRAPLRVAANGSPATDIILLDWQRATLRPRLTVRERVRTLAALRATASPDLLPDVAWRRLVTAYLHASAGHDEPSVAEWLTAIDRAAARMLRRKTILAQRLPAGPAVNQELVRIGGEMVCAIPEIAPTFEDPAAIASAYDPANDGEPVALPTGRSGLLRVSRHASPIGRWLAALGGKPWRSPELKLARLLFHLERHDIPAPKLLAYGQTVPRLTPAGSFVLYERREAAPLRGEHQAEVLALLGRLHAAECRLTGLGPAGEPFGVADGRVVIRGANRLRLARRLGHRMMERDRASVDDFFRGLP